MRTCSTYPTHTKHTCAMYCASSTDMYTHTLHVRAEALHAHIHDHTECAYSHTTARAGTHTCTHTPAHALTIHTCTHNMHMYSQHAHAHAYTHHTHTTHTHTTHTHTTHTHTPTHTTHTHTHHTHDVHAEAQHAHTPHTKQTEMLPVSTKLEGDTESDWLISLYGTTCLYILSSKGGSSSLKVMTREIHFVGESWISKFESIFENSVLK